ncbi:hypothetical protein BD626DRAFT_547865 [Schizophyllum amplum]|uniref:Ubiquitin-like protease family profile domain-containing protein n=1 Tax=Schizophyllum amplum TaxID=97359 RepID=A0A550CH92_9AGAR|nr:hypothetical protein BD626DRAFT_547865 [Auriculariopsis ampla]
MRTLSDDDKEPMASQEDADMSQNMDAMHIDESSSSDPLLLQDSLKETAKDPSSVLDDDGESTLRQSSDRHERVVQKKPVVHELSDEETPKTGGIQPAQFYGSHPVRRTYGSKNAKSQKAKGKQRAEPEPSDDIEIQDGEAEPELLRRDQTLVITFDSLGSQHQSAVKKLNTYLGLEARDKKGVENVSDVKGKMASVPVQPNFCDCGIYLIHFFRTFLSDPNFYLRQICAERKKSRDHGERKKVWHEEEVGSMRQTLKEIIEEESAKYKKAKAEKDKEKEEQKKKQVAEAMDEESSESDIDIVEVNGPPPSASKARSQSKRGGAKLRPRS